MRLICALWFRQQARTRAQEEAYDLERHGDESRHNSSMLIYHHETQTTIPRSSALTITPAHLHVLHRHKKAPVISARAFRQPVTWAIDIDYCGRQQSMQLRQDRDALQIILTCHRLLVVSHQSAFGVITHPPFIPHVVSNLYGFILSGEHKTWYSEKCLMKVSWNQYCFGASDYQ